MSNVSKSAARAAAAAAVADFAATGRAVTVGKPGPARAPATEPDDNDVARAAAAAVTAARDATPAAPANPYDEYGPVIAPAAPAADWLDEFGPVVAPAAPPAATAPAKASGVKGWAKADAVYHADDAVIEYVARNPKKPGSATYRRYAAAYAVGRTIAQAKALGATAGDILWDIPRGFIRLRAPAAATPAASE